MRTELKNITTASDVSNMDYFIGTHNNGDGTYTDYKFTYDQLASLGSKRILVIDTQNTLIDPFFENIISEIVTDRQSYISDVDFTQSGNEITGITFSFYDGQILIAKV